MTVDAIVVELCLSGFVFFFQAEDGIRDLTVTGVQTCALPISTEGGLDHHPRAVVENAGDLVPGHEWIAGERVQVERDVTADRGQVGAADEIGRASCRERV